MKNLNINYKKLLSLILAFKLSLFTAPSVKTESFFINNNHYPVNRKFIKECKSICFHNRLKKAKVFSQDDEDFKWIKYNGTTVGMGGCGPMSITNALSIAFNIESKEEVELLLYDILSTTANTSVVHDILVGNIQKNCNILNKLISITSANIYDCGVGAYEIFEQVKNSFDDNENYYFGLLYFDNDNFVYLNEMINHIYRINPNTNILLYKMNGGTRHLGRAFGSIENSGHYVTLLINVREYVDNNAVYLIDSLARNIHDEKTYGIEYNFAYKPYVLGNKVFNTTYKVTRISSNILKIKANDKFSNIEISTLGLNGGSGLIIAPDYIIEKDFIDDEINSKVFVKTK